MPEELRGIDWKMTNALNDFDTFKLLLNKGDRQAAFDLLKKINLPLVGKYYKEIYDADSKEMAIYNCASVMHELLKLKDDYKKGRQG
jgi:hypothetical protein